MNSNKYHNTDDVLSFETDESNSEYVRQIAYLNNIEIGAVSFSFRTDDEPEWVGVWLEPGHEHLEIDLLRHGHSEVARISYARHIQSDSFSYA